MLCSNLRGYESLEKAESDLDDKAERWGWPDTFSSRLAFVLLLVSLCVHILVLLSYISPSVVTARLHYLHIVLRGDVRIVHVDELDNACFSA